MSHPFPTCDAASEALACTGRLANMWTRKVERRWEVVRDTAWPPHVRRQCLAEAVHGLADMDPRLQLEHPELAGILKDR